MRSELRDILDQEGFVSTARHPHLARAVEYCVSRGTLVKLIGSSYALAGREPTFDVRIAAARAARPNSVFVRDTSARLSWWPTLPVDAIQLAEAARRAGGKGYKVERREVPPELKVWTGQHFITAPALSVLDLTDTLGGNAIDEALRRKAVTILGLRRALSLTSGRRGNGERARLLRESREQPWSYLEREAHIRLRRARIGGWFANHRVAVGWKTYFVDVALPEHNLAVELDGWEHHGSHDSFISDRIRWNDLTIAGWTLLNFTAATIGNLVPTLRQAMALKRSGKTAARRGRSC
ncbi:MAG TPA: endonuclease domain-containing protein [Tessaracoccus flavescens]|uniref:Endonuclease domain-containing protein n=1 Tax=Tessaracoccus flavescens TaxID=399497 RepID=A0A921EMG9_9ACTN|nr:endonuclease domain-containing protein [Tessaracoccus flavescens]